MKDFMVACPVCDAICFNEAGDFDICQNCGWENDSVQYSDHSYWGGANHLSVNESRIVYQLSKNPQVSNNLEVIYKEYIKQIQYINSKYLHIDHSTSDGEKVRLEHKINHDNFIAQLILLENNKS